ncbi:MAG: NAD(P)-binding protein [Cyanobacteria bacterium SZAS LIN-2]|nr:NAD(P)-binding protein [Cyanobacteria bacterium SZAS LIN-2]
MSSYGSDDLSRRAFLLQLSGLMAAAYALDNQTALAQTLAKRKGDLQAPAGYTISPWTGDDFTLGHRMRSGDGPSFPKHAHQKVDFVVVGGGMAGLASAYRLRNENFLLLEQYNELGGTSKGGEHHGLAYSMGAAYYSQEEGPVAELVDKFGLKPAVLGPDKNSFYFEKNWVNGVDGADSNLLYRNFKRLRSDLTSIMASIGDQEPVVPVQNAEMLKLDRVNFAGLLTAYDAPFRQFVDRILMSSACADSQRTNALAGSILANDFFNNSFVLPGGNPALARALAAAIKGKSAGKSNHVAQENAEHERLKTGCFVWAVEIKENGASVVYSDRSGKMHRVDCRHVIMATLPMVTGRILSGVKNEAKASLFWFRYGSYLVANIICKKRIFKGTYDNFVAPPFDFTDLTVAETPYLKNNTYKPNMGSVLTVYHPWQPGTMGRAVLQEGNRQKLAADLVGSLGELIPGLKDNIDKIIMTRWGHAINIAQVGYYGRISKINSTFGDSYTLSHSSLQGIQCIESAILAGNLAADRALKKKAALKGARSVQTSG